MRKFVFIFLAQLIVLSAFAQNKNPQSAITAASMSLDMYEGDPNLVKELLTAQTNIDYAAEHEKTKDNSKVWKYRARIYNKISTNPQLAKENKRAAIIALESWTKAWNLDKAKLEEKGKPMKRMPTKLEYKTGIEETCGALYNAGAEAYTAGKHELAYSNFMGILTVRPMTKEGLAKKPLELLSPNKKIDMEAEGKRLGGLAACNIGKCAEAEKYLMPLLEGKKMDEKYIPSTYSMIVNCYDKAGKTSKAGQIIAKAREDYPTNQSLLISEINMALKEGNLAEIESKLKQAVEIDKENVELHFVLGNVYDELFRKQLEKGDEKMAKDFFDKAVNWYKKANDLNPKHFNSVYSLGAIYVNYSNSLAQEINKITDYKDPKLKELEKKYGKLLDTALGYLLKAEEINSKDLGTAVALKEVYARKRDDTNAKRYSEKVKQLRQK